MPDVIILCYWRGSDLLRQTPGQLGEWGGRRFHCEVLPNAEYAVVLTDILEPITVPCSSDRIWALAMEPPDEAHLHCQEGPSACSRVYTTDVTRLGTRFIHSQVALPWHVNKSYDELKRIGPEPKHHLLSSICSTKAITAGHRSRLAFIRSLPERLGVHYYGKGICPIGDKWDGLAPYRYSIAIENFSNQYYWTEKIADCFLSWTMPVYYGCTEIEKYFPEEAMIRIDIKDPTSYERIEEAIANDRWAKSLDAIAEARRLVLDEYQLFPFLCHEMDSSTIPEAGRGSRRTTIEPIGSKNGSRLRKLARRVLRRKCR